MYNLKQSTKIKFQKNPIMHNHSHHVFKINNCIICNLQIFKIIKN